MGLKGKNVVVTGGCGFIGSNLCAALVRAGARVTAVDNFVAGKKENVKGLLAHRTFKVVKADVRFYRDVQKFVKGADIVFHLAASKLIVSRDNPRVDLETNIVGTFNILEAARQQKRKIRIIHASTGSVLGSSNAPMKEDHPTNPTTLYGISKLTAERYCKFYAREFGLDVRVIRYFHVFGPHQDYRGKAGVINIFLYRVLSGKQPLIYGSGRQIRCFTFVEDDVRATMLLACKEGLKGEVFNVASPVRMSVKDLADFIIARYAHTRLTPKFLPARPGENMYPVPDTKKIEALGFKTHASFEEGVEKTKVWIAHDIKAR
jgi:nucleoside-diphosphate-sugar epimerase